MLENKEDLKNEGEKTPVQNGSTEEENQEIQSSNKDESKKEEDLEEKIDYKALLDKEREARKKAEEAIVKHKKEKKSDPEDIESIIAEKVNEIVSQKLSGVADKLQDNVVDKTLEQLSNDQDERELIKDIYENRLKKTGLTREEIISDLTSAKLIANQAKIIKENQQLKEALGMINSSSNAGIGNNQKKPNNTEVITDEDRKIADKFFSGDIKRYLKTKQKN